MNLLTIDFETYYSQQFSLSKMTTEEYIRSPEFEVIGVSVQQDDAKPEWCSGTKEEISAFLNQYDWRSSMMLAHNAVFDAAILSWHFGIKPKAIFDTLSMARALHGTEVGGSLKALAEHYQIGVKGDEVVAALGKHRQDFTDEELSRYGRYCKNDVTLTYDLFYKLLDRMPDTELKLIDLTLRMFTEPKLVLDRKALEAHLVSVVNKKDELMQRINVTKDDLMSNPKFAEVLRGFGVLPPVKTSLTTGKETLAFSKSDEEFKALLEHENPDVQAIVAARLGVKSTLEETRTQRFIEISQRGLMPVPLRYYAAHTGRWGGDDKVNLQNLPRSSPLKKAIKAPPGFVVIDSDSSQIEARTLAWLAEQDDLVDAFADGKDVYKKTASSIYGKPEDQIVPHPERFVGKTTVLGAGYGMGAAKFQAQLKNFGVELAEDECKRIVSVYRETYPKIPMLWRQAQEAVEAMALDQTVSLGKTGVLEICGVNGIKLPNGLYLKYPNLRQEVNTQGNYEYVYDTKRGKQILSTKLYGGKLIENVCQALARIVIGEQLIQIAKKYRVVLTVHDAVACIAPEEEAEEAMQYVTQCMKKTPTWAAGLPLNCEAGFGQSYGDC